MAGVADARGSGIILAAAAAFSLLVQHRSGLAQMDLDQSFSMILRDIWPIFCTPLLCTIITSSPGSRPWHQGLVTQPTIWSLTEIDVISHYNHSARLSLSPIFACSRWLSKSPKSPNSPTFTSHASSSDSVVSISCDLSLLYCLASVSEDFFRDFSLCTSSLASFPCRYGSQATGH